MKIFGRAMKKVWVFAAATALIAGSTSVMAFALTNTVPQGAQKNIAATISSPAESGPARAGATAEKKSPVYTVVDRTKQPIDVGKLKEELSHKPGMTPDKIDSAVQQTIANTTPGDKDMTADQAAAYCAAIVQKAYGIDLTGLTAEASFSKNPLPYSDNWEVIFRVPNETDSSVRYYAVVNSVTGAMLNAGFYDLTFQESNDTDLNNPDWTATARKDIEKLLPADVTITGIKVVASTPLTGVSVVSTLSDGSACGVRLSGTKKDAVVYINFPNGYDGSMDLSTPVTGGVG